MKKGMFSLFFICGVIFANAQDIQLNAPQKTGGKSLMETLSERKSERSYIKKEMSIQQLSDLLWATYGFNREDKRTVPSSQNRQEIDVYVMFDNGIYFYDAKENLLRLIKSGDFREVLGQPHISMDAAFSFVFVANLDKASSRDAAFTDTGYISQNVYLYAASFGLGTVARGSFNRNELTQVLNLNENQLITLVQPIGFLQ